MVFLLPPFYQDAESGWPLIVCKEIPGVFQDFLRQSKMYFRGLCIRELSFLMLGTGAEEFLEGYQILLPCDIGLPNNFAIS